MYHYAANNPVSYVDPDGRDISAVAQNQSFWTGVGIILGTLAEDVATFGAGIADDPATLAIGVGLILAAYWVTSNGNNQASPSPLFGSNANVAAASPNPLPPDGDDEPYKDNQKLTNKDCLSKADIEKRTNSNVHEIKKEIKKQYGKEMKRAGISENFDLYESDGKLILKGNKTGNQLNLNIPLESLAL